MPLGVRTGVESSSALKAWTISGAMHAGVITVLAFGGPAAERAQLAGRPGDILLEVMRAEPAPAEASDESNSDVPVLITPESARIFERRFTNEPASIARKADAIPPAQLAPLSLSLARRAMIAEPPRLHETFAPAAIPRKQFAFEGTVPSPAAVGTDGRIAPNFDGNAPPVYPASAVADRIEGTVLLRVRIAADGRVVQVDVAKSSGHPILDGAAVNAVEQWQGKPAHVGGVAVESTELLPVRFELQNTASGRR